MILTQEIVDVIAEEFKKRDTEIERSKHENEMTKLTCDRVQEKYEDAKKERERLRKENEWLIKEYSELAYLTNEYQGRVLIECEEIIKKDMQRALKGK